ncbi:unnamed protein product [Clonostachys rosea]|uniref:NWD NACHT-NTPase N-terminal domain-containing protein n=1 Tax=Bionectria ochroleuca TaxID=29856 RepID=A0ABY6V3L8_BIOOC|nr:unnamed protein product [Clonostachys rosea]
MSSFDLGHVHGAPEDSEQAAFAAPDILPAGRLPRDKLVMELPQSMNGDVKKAFEDFKQVVSQDDLEEFADASPDSFSTVSLITEDTTTNRECLESIITGLTDCSKVIQSVCGDTSYPPWVLAPAHLFLKLKYPKGFAKIVEVYLRATNLMHIYLENEDILRNDNGLTELLAMMYATLIKLHIQKYKIVRGANWENLFLEEWADGQPNIDEIINTLEAHRNTFDDRIYFLEGIKYEKMILEGFGMCKQMNRTPQYLASIDLLGASESEQPQILDSIISGASKPFFSHYWLLKHRKFQEWAFEDDSPAFLVLEAFWSYPNTTSKCSIFTTGPCLSAFDFKTRLESYPLYAYAARHWGHHAFKAADPDLQWIVDFLEQDVLVRGACQAMKADQNGCIQELETRMTGLHLAVLFGLEEVIRAMLKPGYDPSSAKDSQGHTPLDWAIEQNKEPIVKLLLIHETITAFDAVREGNLPRLKLLLRTGYDPNELGTWNRILLHEAAIQGHTDCIVELLSSGASINERDGNGETALDLPIRMKLQHNKSDVLLLAQLPSAKSSLDFLPVSDTAEIQKPVDSAIKDIDKRHLL